MREGPSIGLDVRDFRRRLALLVVVDEHVDGRWMPVLAAESVSMTPYNSSTRAIGAAARHRAQSEPATFGRPTGRIQRQHVVVRSRIPSVGSRAADHMQGVAIHES